MSSEYDARAAQRMVIARQVAQVLADIHSVPVPNTYGRVFIEADTIEVYSDEGDPELLPVVKHQIRTLHALMDISWSILVN